MSESIAESRAYPVPTTLCRSRLRWEAQSEGMKAVFAASRWRSPRDFTKSLIINELIETTCAAARGDN